MGERARRSANARAARLLDEEGADLDTVAAHLLLAEPMADEWVVAELREAAASAIGRGAPEAAVGYLRRALEEPPPAAERIAVQRELGLALLRGDDEEGIGVLRQVHETAESREERAEVAAVLSNSLMFRARHAEAEAILRGALEENPDLTDRLGINLRLHILLATLGGFERLPERYLPGPEEEVATDLVEGRAILGQAALLYALGMGPMGEVPRLVERMGSDADVQRSDARVGYPGNPPLLALSLADRGDLVLTQFPNLLVGSEARGTLSGVTGVYGTRAYCRLLDGELSEAQADAETALRISVEAKFVTPLMSWLGAAARAMTARGEAEAAIALVDRFADEIGGVPPGIPGAAALVGRGEALQALSRHAEACDDFRAADGRLAWIPWLNPEAQGCRPGLARSLAALGQDEEAGRVAAECLEQAERAGGPRGIGVALRLSGAVGGGPEASRAAAPLGGAARLDPRTAAARRVADRARRRAAPCQPPQGSARAARRGARDRPSLRCGAARGAGAHRAGGGRRPAAKRRPHGGRVAHSERAARRVAGLAGDDEPRGRPGADRDPEDGGDATSVMSSRSST